MISSLVPVNDPPSNTSHPLSRVIVFRDDPLIKYYLLIKEYLIYNLL